MVKLAPREDHKSASTYRVTSKLLLKSLFIKNNVRTVDLSRLDVNSREAFDAIRRCTTGNFVSKVDLSGNSLNCRLLGQLKREKLSRYLKTIVMQGLQIDARELKREGLVY